MFSSIPAPLDVNSSPFAEREKISEREDNFPINFAFDELTSTYFKESVLADVNLFEEGRQAESEILLQVFILSYLELGYPDNVCCCLAKVLTC